LSGNIIFKIVVRSCQQEI